MICTILENAVKQKAPSFSMEESEKEPRPFSRIKKGEEKPFELTVDEQQLFQTSLNKLIKSEHFEISKVIKLKIFIRMKFVAIGQINNFKVLKSAICLLIATGCIR